MCFFFYRSQCPPHYLLCSSHPGYLSAPRTAPDWNSGPDTTSPLIAGLRENVWGLIVPTNNNSIKMSNNHCEKEKQLKQLQNYESLWTTWLVVKVQIWSPAPVQAITWKEKSEWRCKYRQQTREKLSHMPTQPNWSFKIIFQFNIQVSLLKITVWSLKICCISRLVWHRLMTYLADCLSQTLPLTDIELISGTLS